MDIIRPGLALPQLWRLAFIDITIIITMVVIMAGMGAT